MDDPKPPTIRRRLALIRRPIPLPLPEMQTVTDHDLAESIQKLWVTGRSDLQVKRTLNLSDSRFLQLVSLIKTTNVDPETARSAYSSYVYEYEKFKLRAEARLDALASLLEKSTERHPLLDFPRDLRGAHLIVKSMSQLDTELL